MKLGSFQFSIETALGWWSITATQFNPEWVSLRVDGPIINGNQIVRGSIEIPAGHEREAFDVLAEAARLGKLVTEEQP